MTSQTSIGPLRGESAVVGDLEPGKDGAANRIPAWLADFRQKYQAPFITLVVMGFLARAQNWAWPGYSIDDYQESLTNGPDKLALALAQGRYGMAALWWLRGQLDFFGMPAATSATAMSTVCLALAGILFAVAIARRPSRNEVLIFGAIFSLHPYLTQWFYFSGATLNMSLPTLFAAAGMAVVALAPGMTGVAIGAVAVAAALSIYQVVVGQLGALFLLAIAWRLCLAGRSREALKAEVKPLGYMLAALVGGVLLYVVGLVIVGLATGVHIDARGDVGHLTLADHAAGFALGLSQALWPAAELIHRGPSVILIVALLLSLGAMVVSLARSSRWAVAAFATTCLAIAIVWSSGSAALAGVIWMVPRVISPASLAFAGVLMIGWRFGRHWIRGALAIAVTLLCIAYVGASNQILFDTHRVNQWDMAQANRIIGRLEADPNFPAVKAVDMIGGRWARPLPVQTVSPDMNVSAFAVAWAKNPLLDVATGYSFRDATASEDSAAKAFCAQAPEWPAAGSTVIQGPVAVVCLSKL